MNSPAKDNYKGWINFYFKSVEDIRGQLPKQAPKWLRATEKVNVNMSFNTTFPFEAFAQFSAKIKG